MTCSMMMLSLTLGVFLQAPLLGGNRVGEEEGDAREALSEKKTDALVHGNSTRFLERALAVRRSGDLPISKGLKWPQAISDKWGWTNPIPIGCGSFGAVWSAKAGAQSCSKCIEGERYAIKVFFAAPGVFVTWDNADQYRKRKELNEVITECNVAAQLREGSRGNDDRADLIMECVANRVSYFEGHIEGADPLFLVLKLGGAGLDAWWLSNGPKRSIQDVKSLMRQSLHALSFLAGEGIENPEDEEIVGWIHHDLKTENMAVRFGESHDELLLQLIDFGAMMEGSMLNEQRSSVSNGNAPPEWGDKAFTWPYPFVFDVFCMANVFVELVAGESLIFMYYESSNPETGQSDRNLWCQRTGVTRSCYLHHAMYSFWTWLKAKNGGRNHEDIKKVVTAWARYQGRVVGNQPVKKKLAIKKAFYDKLIKTEKKSFESFLDLVGQMFRNRAKNRKRAQEVLNEATAPGQFLDPHPVVEQNIQSHEVKHVTVKVEKEVATGGLVPDIDNSPVVIENFKEQLEARGALTVQAKTQSQESNIVATDDQTIEYDAITSPDGHGVCSDAKGRPVKNVYYDIDKTMKLNMRSEKCEGYCTADPGCHGYTLTTLAGTHQCRLHTTRVAEYKVVPNFPSKKWKGANTKYASSLNGEFLFTGKVDNLHQSNKVGAPKGLRGGDFTNQRCYRKKLGAKAK